MVIARTKKRLSMPRSQPFAQAIARPKAIPGPECNIWWWNPGRHGIKLAPDAFMYKLKEVGEELSCTWNPLTERWYLWSKAPEINHKICQGWRLLFVNQEVDGSYLPLDERVFARLYLASSLHRNETAVQYFDRIAAEMQRDKEKAEKQRLADQIDLAMPYFDHSQIKVAMRGPSNGSKFSTYHA